MPVTFSIVDSIHCGSVDQGGTMIPGAVGQEAEPMKIGVSISAVFTGKERQEALGELQRQFPTYEVQLQRGGFPLPVEIFFQLHGADIAAGLVVAAITSTVKKLLGQFQAKRAANPDARIASVPTTTIQIRDSGRIGEFILHTTEPDVADHALKMIGDVVAGLPEEADSPADQTARPFSVWLFDQKTGSWKKQ